MRRMRALAACLACWVAVHALPVGVAVAAGAPAALGAQQQPPRRPPPPAPADTGRRPAPTPPRAPADTGRRPATPAPGDSARGRTPLDTVRATGDSVKVAAPVTGVTPTEAQRIDSVRGIPDSTPRRVVRDSIKAPLGRGELPAQVGVGPLYRWTQDSVLATGATSALDLLERVPGLVGFRSGWLASAQSGAYLGDFRRVRVFRDGVELDAIDPRTNGILDLPDLQLWQAEEVVIERAAGEVRVHLRTWSVRNTTALTRVDVATGDEDTNLYRGFFGKRFTNGGALQIAAQNFGTGARNRRIGGGGAGTFAMGRFGWARGRLSIDALLTRVDRERNPTFAFESNDTTLARFEGRRDEAYLRATYGDPDAGPWVQAIANVLDFRLSGTGSDSIVAGRPASPGRPAVLPDTLRGFFPDSGGARTQYVLAGGLTRWGARLSATGRYRVFGGRGTLAPSVRASYERGWLSVAGFAERAGVDSTSRVDVNARLQPLAWLAVLGAWSRDDRTLRAPGDTVSRAEVGGAWRAELAARLGGFWLTGGRVVRQGATLAHPGVFALRDSGASFRLPLVDRTDARAAGTLVTARGRVYKDVYVDVHGLLWDEAGLYRPRYHLRTEAGVRTNWTRRFPRGDFGFLFAVENEYRSRVQFPIPPVATAAEGSFERAGLRLAPAANVLNARLELRILSGTLTYQLRNALARRYELVPGTTMPGPINFYGVRWYFWN